MRASLKIDIQDIHLFKQKLLTWGNSFDTFVFLDSNDFTKINKEFTYYEYDFLAGVNVNKDLTASEFNGFKKLTDFSNVNDWIFGYLTYDLKNETENLKSENIDELLFPATHFFVPGFVFTCKSKKIEIHFHENDSTIEDITKLILAIQNTEISFSEDKTNSLKLKSRFSKNEYISTVEKLKHHIQIGDIYEVNFCQEFYIESKINALETFFKLKDISPTPFSCFYKLNNNYLICASPERFIKKTGTKVISQPIKGTIRRGKTEQEDILLKEKLLNDPKERAENVMIVDLVRNDLSRTAKKGTVNVEELFGIYSFKQVHQMISTVVSEVESTTNIVDIIKNAFPMGSMTGAPKIRAMQLIEQYEKTKRGLYSGTIGFITPEKDFDFNVVIRSILYNEAKNYVSFTVGGAITSLSEPEKEYDECMIKAKAITDLFNI
ncbi:MAG: aminodeoxychorismate synthase component I [Bacteroidetes bacterium GWC2_33_15]|nr:MAG: aminodeoxychorismate synthase component I [Bacteroidetes bacterium GWA2_33_15]OFX49725.1 MAG: aminodeoxychorismate synthase component I [Bacteroidetes bacterium GWC2_33_15]OFX65885.1 MAG: aminodeoxychorismate synthase component I [Bacteroidetes bacterium GWB2_32_14]OFX68354.1 MAG: aminodeoxychorismate synthase component I [Bacteroidetes bacterium GWD2_33_33]HAN18142.1 aminodeoxychorismate synthase component I [Bacteroidales bacterium]